MKVGFSGIELNGHCVRLNEIDMELISDRSDMTSSTSGLYPHGVISIQPVEGVLGCASIQTKEQKGETIDGETRIYFLPLFDGGFC